MACAVVKRRCLDPSGVFVLLVFFECKKASTRQRGRAMTGNRTRSSVWACPPCANAIASYQSLPVLPPPQHLTGISAALRHSLLSSLPFHQNIADEVLSSINHSAAPLHSPSINQQVCCTAGPGLLVSSPDVLTRPNAFTYKHIQDGTSRSLVCFWFRRRAGLLLTLVNSNRRHFSNRKSGLSRRTAGNAGDWSSSHALMIGPSEGSIINGVGVKAQVGLGNRG